MFPSALGPLEVKFAGVMPSGAMAPTEITLSASDGVISVLSRGPSFPAAVMQTTPRFTASLTILEVMVVLPSKSLKR